MTFSLQVRDVKAFFFENFYHHGSIEIMLPSPRQLPYAPTPYSYMPDSSLSANINLDQVLSPPLLFYKARLSPSRLTKIPRANVRLT